jgi:rhodanese-related sulfurtransferase
VPDQGGGHGGSQQTPGDFPGPSEGDFPGPVEGDFPGPSENGFPGPGGGDPAGPGELELEELEYLYNHLLIMPETLLYRMLEGDTGYVLYDLRNEEQFRRVRLTGAVSCPWRDGELSCAGPPPRDRDLILISENGNTALRVLHRLVLDGYDRVYSVEGGMENWMYRDYLVGEASPR